MTGRRTSTSGLWSMKISTKTRLFLLLAPQGCWLFLLLPYHTSGRGLSLLPLCHLVGVVISTTLRSICLYTMTPFSLCNSVRQEASLLSPGLRESVFLPPSQRNLLVRGRIRVETKILLLSRFVQTLCQLSVLLLLIRALIL